MDTLQRKKSRQGRRRGEDGNADTTATNVSDKNPNGDFWQLSRAKGILTGVALAFILVQSSTGLFEDSLLPGRAVQHKQLRSSDLVRENDPSGENNQLLSVNTTTGSSKITPELQRKERNILMVHVGKCGGTTLRQSTGIKCHVQVVGGVLNYNAALHGPSLDQCVAKQFQPDQVLARQTRFVFHWHDYNAEMADNATSFLFTLRNPVDRIVSTYRYSHPGNCLPPKLNPSYGCHVRLEPNFTQTESSLYKTWKTCFPFPAIEQFAQSMMRPYPDHQFSNNTLVTQLGWQWPCRKRARDMVLGRSQGKDVSPGNEAAPHMLYNYKYYVQRTIEKYPDKEVLVVRTAHEWDDMVALDKFLGGSGRFPNKGHKLRHGSDSYLPSPLSSQGYQKLCCVLKDEIDVYLGILDRAINLDAATKQHTVDTVRSKCGINEVTRPWEDWTAACKRALDKDDDILEHVEYG